MGAFLFDLHDVVRGLRRDRAYACVVAGMLALSLGVTTAVFSIANGVLLKPLPYEGADRLVWLREVWHEVITLRPALDLNERHFEHWRDNSRTFEAMAQYAPFAAHLTSGGEPSEIDAVRSSGSLFDVLKAPALL